MGYDPLRKEGEPMANAEQERIDAVSRYLRGESASAICRAQGRSRRWLYLWLKRYEPGDPTWAQSRSRAPRRVATKTAEEVEHLVCALRERLAKTKYAQKGALAIQWQLRQLRVDPLPALWTINRILKRHGLVVKARYQPRGITYPRLVPTRPNDVHQLDLVGPRYLEGGRRFYGVHCIDAYSRAVALAAVPSKRDTDVVDAVVAGWQRLGIPRVLPVENELFFRTQRFRGLAHLADELRRFETFHNTQHRYAVLGQHVPWEVHTAGRRRLLPQRFTVPQRGLPFREGRVSFVRLTDDQGRVRFFSESFLVDGTLVHEYVTGTVFTRAGLLKFVHQHRLITIYRYAVTKT